MPTREDIRHAKKTLNNDKRLRKVKLAFNTLPEYSLDFEDLNKELDTLMTMRSVRSLKDEKGTLSQAVMDAMLQDQSYRSRCTEILMSCVRVDRKLSRTIDKLEDYLMVEYASLISGLYRTVKERKAFVVYVLRRYTDFLDQVEELRERCGLLTGDIDKAGFAMKNTIEALNLASMRREV